MSTVFTYPNINPVALHLGPLPVHWYGLMYLFGFLTAWLLLRYRAKSLGGLWTKEQLSDVIFYGALGAIIGGRIGYMLFYDTINLLHMPWLLFKVWQGGMSFHGGLLGVLFAMWLFARRYNKTFFEVSDFISPVVPVGLAAGRLGNFINGELWGRITEVPWAMVYPQVDRFPRHPSQVYEFLLEGVFLFLILWVFSHKPRPRMAVSGLFLLCYGLFRFVGECFRQPDVQLGFIVDGQFTMGQLLSAPMVVAGFILIVVSYRKRA